MIRIVLINFITMCYFIPVVGQSSVRWDKAIKSIENSELLNKIESNNERIEKQVENFYLSRDLVHIEDFDHVGKNYEEVRLQIDAVLDQIKEDFTMTLRRRQLVSNPNMYYERYNDDIDNAYSLYLNSCQRDMDQMVSSTEGAFGFSEISLIIGIASELVKYIDKEVKRTRKMSAEYFENNCLKNYRLKKWEEY